MTYEAAKRKAKKLGGSFEPTYSNGGWDAKERDYSLKAVSMYGKAAWVS